MRQKAEEESKRTVEAARKEIEAERDQAVRSVRSEVANLGVAATEKGIGETLEDDNHQRLIDKAIKVAESGNGSGLPIHYYRVRASPGTSPVTLIVSGP